MIPNRWFVLSLVALVGCTSSSAPDATRPSGKTAQGSSTDGPKVALPTKRRSQFKGDRKPFPRMDDWYADHLKAMKEPLLFANVENNHSEVFRFLYLPSFHNPMVIRIEKAGDKITLVSKRLSGKGGYDPGELTDHITKTLDASAWSALQAHVQQSGFWNLPTTETNTYINDQGMQVGWSMTDGAAWIVEAVQDGKYHVVDRQSPDDVWHRDCGKYRRLCTYMLQLSDLKPRELY